MSWKRITFAILQVLGGTAIISQSKHFVAIAEASIFLNPKQGLYNNRTDRERIISILCQLSHQKISIVMNLGPH